MNSPVGIDDHRSLPNRGIHQGKLHSQEKETFYGTRSIFPSDFDRSRRCHFLCRNGGLGLLVRSTRSPLPKRKPLNDSWEGGRTNSSSPLPVLPLSGNPNGWPFPSPPRSGTRDLISRPPRNRTLSRGGLLPGRSSGFRNLISRRFSHRSPPSPAEGDRVVFPDPSLLGLSGERRPEIGAFEKLRRPS